jgi:cytochrome b561
MGYGTVARLFHWLTVLAVLIMVPVGLTMIQEGVPRPVQDRLFILHKGLGPVVFVLVVLRLGWRLLNPPPPLPDSIPRLQQRVANTTHRLLYLFLLIMASSGYVRVTTGGFPIEFLDWLGIPPLFSKNEPVAEVAKAIHATAIFGLLALIALHVSGALYHWLWRKDRVIFRMWPPLAGSETPARD